MPAPQMEPFIAEPDPGVTVDPDEEAQFVLYDEDFRLEYREQFQVNGSCPLRVPHFGWTSISSWVFGHNSEWMRNRLKRKKGDPLLLNGEPLAFRRLLHGRQHGTAGGERRLTLPDIERLAWALYERGDIDAERLQTAVQILSLIARQHGVTARDHTPS